VGRELLRMVRQLKSPVVMVRPKNGGPADSVQPIAANGREL
jgi:hypothetical protein